MSNKPIFVATHPRACSTAFERVFMTRRDTLATIHEPFGDAFYYGPERMSPRFEDDEDTRVQSSFSKSTYKTIFDRITREGSEEMMAGVYASQSSGQEKSAANEASLKVPSVLIIEGKRVFIKDITYYLVPPEGKPARIAPSILPAKRGIGTEINGDPTDGHLSNGAQAPFPYDTAGEPGNPTIVPSEMLKQFHWAFLIRNPHSSIPSYYRCTIPPLDKLTGFYEFYPSEAGYDELRRLFDYLKSTSQVGPGQAKLAKGYTNGTANDVMNDNLTNGPTHGSEICLIDADDLLDDPEAIIQSFCKSVGLDYDPKMLTWDNEEDQAFAKETFEKWKGFHEDAIDSEDLKPRQTKKKEKSEAEWDAEWKKIYGEEGHRVIRETVDAQMADYLYLKQFAIKI